ncbi:MAG: Holliday junction resolvase RuvX [bacterium]|nr:Holliday junction resolvase RuvX [bacterium]
MPSNLRVIAVDPGKKRTGIAIGETRTGMASPFKTLTGSFEHVVGLIANIIRKERIDIVLLGRPEMPNGMEHAITRLSDNFAEKLRATGAIVISYDEHLSSFAAEEYLKERGISYSKDKGIVDRTAAALLLEQAIREGIFVSLLEQP